MGHAERVVMEWTRRSIELLERALGPGRRDRVTGAEFARYEHQLWWARRYLDHLEMGGELLRPADEWAQHHEHDLTIKQGPPEEGAEIILFCRTCDDPVWANVPEESGEDMAAKYAEHLGHDIRTRRDEGPEERRVAVYGFDIGLDCHTCKNYEDGPIALFSDRVSDWFDELWNG